MYPYSEMATLDAATSDSVTRTRDSVQAIRSGQINYVRNSVKATVDAYDGTVKLYQWDDKDPILTAWMKIFPDALTPLSEIKGSLMEHLRYPEDLFKIQRQLRRSTTRPTPRRSTAARRSGASPWTRRAVRTQSSRSSSRPTTCRSRCRARRSRRSP